MPRIRTIKPNHVNDKELSRITLQAHLFWILSWCFSDDEGVIENDPLLLKSQIFPRRTDIRLEHIEQWIDQLVSARFMIPFTHESDRYLITRTFKTHQRIDRPQPSKIPESVIRRIIDEHSTNDRPCIVEESIVKESKGENGDSPKNSIKNFNSKKNNSPPPSPPPKIVMPFSEIFIRLWGHWKAYKLVEFKFKYNSCESEQAALNELVTLSEGKEENAVAIVNQSMANGWKGFFKIKEAQHGTGKNKRGDTETSTASAFAKINSMPDKT